ncbi:MAG: hypothetical protein CBD88_07865 [Flavobacteriales bacterium TMED228]|nr:MAG: hypothetical protein CBD88_07865 [Flavobacteriales bacterium TMED228]|tara:strand:- start:4701 stop:5753 length:1053 start_codon:yes stop_codon:yes gene_type:complete
MRNLTFKNTDVEVHLVYGTSQYKLDFSEISFGQTFIENSYAVKTLQSQSSFEGSVINRANPAEFEINIPLLANPRNKVLFDRLLDVATFDLYISSHHDVFKLEKCVIQNGTFQINKSRPLRLTLQGEASKLSNYTPDASNLALSAMNGRRVIIIGTGDVNFESVGASANRVGVIFTANDNLGSGTGIVRPVAPGNLLFSTSTDYTYIIPKLTKLTLGGVDVSRLVINLSLELENDISWNGYTTIQGAVSATNAATSMYPSNFTVGTKVLGGSIRKYLEQDSSTALTWDSSAALDLKAGTTGAFTGIRVNSTNCTFTNRISTGSEVFQEEFNWRMIQNPTSLTSVLTYTTA